MKIFYYLFTIDGQVQKEVLKARKNKYNYAIDANTEYGGIMHYRISHFEIGNEGKIVAPWSCKESGCYMFSSKDLEITDDMKSFAKERANKIKEIMDIEKYMISIGKDLESSIANNK